MSLGLPEYRAYGRSSPYLAMKAWRLRDRSERSSNPVRAKMLKKMSDACMAFGLAKTHADYGSEQVPMLIEAANEHLKEARVWAKG